MTTRRPWLRLLSLLPGGLLALLPAAAQAKAKQYGVERVPAVAVNGKLADCCQVGSVDASTLRSLGVGAP